MDGPTIESILVDVLPVTFYYNKVIKIFYLFNNYFFWEEKRKVIYLFWMSGFNYVIPLK